MKLTKKKILFISGTRADFGKIKSLLYGVKNSKNLDYSIFITGMHLLKRYDYTYNEIIKSGFNNLHLFKKFTNLNYLLPKLNISERSVFFFSSSVN